VKLYWLFMILKQSCAGLGTEPKQDASVLRTQQRAHRTTAR